MASKGMAAHAAYEPNDKASPLLAMLVASALASREVVGSLAV